MLVFNIFRNEIHRARAIERDARDDVLNRPRLQLLHEILHAGAFKLEHARSVARRQHVEGLLVVHRRVRHAHAPGHLLPA